MTYAVGDKSKAICGKCNKIVTTTFQHRILFLETGQTVDNVLVGVCDECGDSVSIPAQATPQIKKALEGCN